MLVCVFTWFGEILTLTIKPSDIYLNIEKEKIKDFLKEKNCEVVGFRMVKSGELVLFYSNGDLYVGIATVKYAGYPRFILKELNCTNLDLFWE